jgi:DNA uptake protein ComE-like DNA-binding protein
LWILAIITIGVAYFAERVGGSIEQARQKQEATEQLVEFANTRAQILFRLGTTHFSYYGLGGKPSLALDNRAYRGSGDDIVRLQDESGLLNINFVQRNLLLRFLGEIGVPVDKQDALLDTLQDYVDADDLRRLNGAEKAEYAALGLPPPPNELLLTPFQLKNIIGWRDLPGFWENQRLLQFVTTSRLSGFNPNTAPVELLASLPGSNRDIAATMIAARQENPLHDVIQFIGSPPNRLEPEFFSYFPGSSVRVTQQSRKFPWAEQFSLVLTPKSESAPWRVDYHVKTTVPYLIENVDKTPKLPESTAAITGDY